MSIGRVISRAFGTIFSNPLTSLLIALIFGALPSAAFTSLIPALGTEEDLTTFGFVGMLLVVLVSFVASLGIAAISQGVLTRTTVAHAEGRKAGLRESLTAGLRVVFPLMLLAFVASAAVIFGMMLLFVPGIILYCMWAVSVPALVEERLGVQAALRRSRELTRGYRWWVFGALLVLAVVMWLIMGVGAVIGAATGGIEAAIDQTTTSAIILNIVLSTLTTVLWSTMLASLYVELRNAKDGPDAAELQDVFA